MKIAITGHTRGLGSFLAKDLSSSYEIYEAQERIEHVSALIDEVKNCDVFINNAHHKFCQVTLFLGLYDLWRLDNSKLIINIGSRAAEPNISTGFEYSASKAALMQAVKSTVFADAGKKCRVTLLNLGLLSANLPSLSYKSVSRIIKFILTDDPSNETPIIYYNHSAAYLSVQEQKKLLKAAGQGW